MKPTTNLVYWKPGQYVPAAATDVAATFKRIRKEMALRARVEQTGEVPPTNVKPLRRA